jgi:hypothetical protein
VGLALLGAGALGIGTLVATALAGPVGYDPLAESVSTLAALDVPDHWVMTLTFVVVGLATMGTAWYLVVVGRRAGLFLGLAGLGAALTGVVAMPHRGEVFPAHVVVVVPTMLLYAGWSWWAQPDERVWALRGRRPKVVAVILGVALLGPTVTWFVGTAYFGLAERAALCSTAWPVVVAVSALRGRTARPGRSAPGQSPSPG